MTPDKIIADYYFDKDGRINLKKKEESKPPVIMSGMQEKPKKEEERLDEKEKSERLRLIGLYSAKYSDLTIEQIGQLIDDPNIGLGEDFVINKILKKYRKL